MRKLTIIIALFLSISGYSQFSLEGHVKKFRSGDQVEFNLPWIYGYYSENTFTAPIDSNGNFNFTIIFRGKRFGSFSHGEQSETLLVEPGKALTVQLDSLNDSNIEYSGSAEPENTLLMKTELGKIPFFMRKPASNDSTTWVAPIIKAQVEVPWLRARDKKLELINQSSLSNEDKQLISSEIIYEAILQLDYYSSYLQWGKKDRTAYIINLYKDFSFNPQPSAPVPQYYFVGNKAFSFNPPPTFPGPQYYYLVSNYARYMEVKAFDDFQKNGSRADMKLEFFNMTIDSANKLVNLHGKSYVTWLTLKNKLDPKIAEAYLAQQIKNKSRDKSLSELKPLLSELEQLNPTSIYLPDLKNETAVLEKNYYQNLNNPEIKIYPGYSSVSSIYEVIKELKGKVVYLDIWGTWCGPCKYELKHTPQLKKEFKDKDVVFVYLDMDEDNKDEQWKEFIRVNGLTGIHLRKDRKTIQAIWDELIPKRKDQLGYPTYCIFDRKGKLVTAAARRPSEEKALYGQIEEVLKN